MAAIKSTQLKGAADQLRQRAKRLRETTEVQKVFQQGVVHLRKNWRVVAPNHGKVRDHSELVCFIGVSTTELRASFDAHDCLLGDGQMDKIRHPRDGWRKLLTSCTLRAICRRACLMYGRFSVKNTCPSEEGVRLLGRSRRKNRENRRKNSMDCGIPTFLMRPCRFINRDELARKLSASP